ncbi:hypothetical protein [Spirosoma aerolatum]|uniref:hypothetical protein n=1 Tax=Spirosoma aerolatum TaxID=1211326 RepID=UPI0009ADC6C8|nr:hypothetical protein [Spirosoma aerolatum]
MKQIVTVGCLLLFCWTGRRTCLGQNLDPNAYKGGENKLKLTGGLSANMVYTSNQASTITPVSYFVSGNLNLTYKTFTLPFSFNYSNRTFSYSQPFSFNFVTFRPTYKWISAEIGTCFMTFSPYSLNGHQFQGAGVNLTPNRWSISLMYGRLLKATEGDLLATVPVIPTYRRMGAGLKTQYRTDKYTVGLTLFRASDNPASLPGLPDSLRPQPKGNLVVGLDFSTTLFKRLQLNGEYNSSSLNADKNQVSDESISRKSLSGLFFRRGVDVQSYNSIRLGLNYNLVRLGGIIGIDYQRVDPDYVTLGGYYFVNDIENISLRYSQTLFSGKVNFSGSAGLQQDDIEHKKSSSQRRVVGMATINANLSPKLSVGFNFSSYTSYAFIRTAFDNIRKLNPFEQLDTLNYRQINQTVSTNINYAISSTETAVHGLNLSASWMESVSKQGDIVRTGQESGFINSSLLYNYAQPKRTQSFGLGLNGSYNSIGTQQSLSIGPLFNFQKSFLANKLTTNASLAYIYTSDQGYDTQTGAVNLRGSAAYKVDKMNSFAGNLGFTQLAGSGLSARSYVSLTVGYVNRF